MRYSLVKSLCSKENITAQEHITKMVQTFGNRLINKIRNFKILVTKD